MNQYKYNKGFEPMKDNICDVSNELFPTPMPAQVALDILTSYLLGDGFYIALPVNQEQGNAIITEQILDKFSRKWRKDWKNFEKVLKKELKNI